jgi:hypothetical protein
MLNRAPSEDGAMEDRMKHSILGISAALLFGGLFNVNGALAVDGSFTGNLGAMAAGKSITLEDGHSFWTGTFSGSFFDVRGYGPIHGATVTCPGTTDLRQGTNASKLDGYCLISDGPDSIYMQWQCVGTASDCQGTGAWTGGSGKWKGMTATTHFLIRLRPALEDGTVPILQAWHVDYSMPAAVGAVPYNGAALEDPYPYRWPPVRLTPNYPSE